MLEIIKNLNYYQIINDSFSMIFYLIILLGLTLKFKNDIVRTIKSIRRQNRFRAKHKEKVKNPIIKHIETLTTVVYGTNNNQSYIYGFFLLTIILASFIFIITYKQIKAKSAIMLSIIIASIPYLYLQIKLRNIRVSGSHEAEGLLVELINQYKINYFNMIEAIDKSIPYLNDYPYTKQILSRLSFSLKDYKTEHDIQDALKTFVYSIDTEWIMMLSNNIYLAVNDGNNVINALEDILNELKDSKGALEDSKRKNNEGITIMFVMVPILYIGSIILAVKYFNFTIPKFFNYQFKNEIGFKYFMNIIMLSIFNIIMIILFKRKKFDI